MKTPIHQRDIWLHLAGVFIFMMLPILFSPDLFEQISLFQIPPFQREFITYFLLVCFFYLCYLVLIPHLYYRKKFWMFILCMILAIGIIIWLPGVLVTEHHPHNIPKHPHRPMPHRVSFAHYGQYIIASIALLLLAFILKLNNLSRQLKQDKLNAELAYLKTQINPHFLFNTLNSIYALAIQQSNATAEAVVKLSGMMRYVLNDAHAETVTLEKEINYINDYISLQSLRLPEATQINYHVEIVEYSKHITPLLLIPFIENAFTFGVHPEHKSAIDIQITGTFKTIHLYVCNTIVNPTAQNNGLGLKNTKDRLNIVYPGQHMLQIDSHSNKFTVSLTIGLL